MARQKPKSKHTAKLKKTTSVPETPLRQLRDECDLCGACLADCPAMPMKAAQAAREIDKLRSGGRADLLEICRGCFTCNVSCSKGIDVYGAILERLHERGLPPFLRFALPAETDGVFAIEERLQPPAHRALLEKWSRPPASKTCLWVGCNQRLDPYIAASPIFGDIERFSDRNLCCGEPYYRTGALDRAAEQAAKLEKFLNARPLETLVVLCPAGYNMFTNILPNRFGAKWNFEVRSAYAEIRERIERGQIRLKKPLKGRAAIQDSCHAKMVGEDFTGLMRDLVRWTGLEVVEMERSGMRSDCCGLAAFAARGRFDDLAKATHNRLLEAAAAKADYVVSYCNGCNLVLTGGAMAFPWALHAKTTSLIELLDRAAGFGTAYPDRLNLARLFMVVGLGAVPAYAWRTIRNR